jgi:hypothetical protein
MRRLRIVALILAMSVDAAVLLAQRQSGPPPAGRQSGAGTGRQGGAAPGGRQSGPARAVRDRPAEQGTAVIRGRVVTADTGAPVRRAQVQALFGGRRARVVLTDTDGRFELRDLPGGSVILRASKTGFVAQQFGQRSPFSASDPVNLADGQQFSADFALQRGGVITGRVFDEFGDPVANVRVAAMRAQLTAAGPRLIGASGGPGLTDDTGAYRLYGLAPGIYYVAATPQAVNLNVALQSGGGSIAYAATYFPGTTDAGAAERITVGAGQDQHNIDFGLIATPTVQVSGVVVGLGGTPIQAMVNLRGALATDMTGAERRGVATAADGSFTLAGVAPGNYTLDVTGRIRTADVPPEVAAVPIVVGGSDIAGLTVTTTRGATVSGRIATEDGMRVELGAVRVTAAPIRAGAWTARATVKDAAFELTGLVGAYTLRFDQLPSGWIVKSISAGGTDITDVPLEFRGTEQASLGVVLTDRVTQVTGTVRGNGSVRGAGILVFPEDKLKWTPTSRYIRIARADDAGQFTIGGLPGDERYLAVALEYIESGEHLDPDFLNRIRPLAASVSSTNAQPMRLELTLQPRP